jgi:hypothetical protein
VSLVLERPLLAWALVLPPLYLVLVRVLARPPEVVIGTLALWKEIQGSSPRHGARHTAQLPVWAWIVGFALLAGALAAAGPRPGRPRAPRTWTVVVDTSPSTTLPLHPGGPERRAVAVERASAWLRSAARPGDRVLWTAAGAEPLELGRGETPRSGWFSATRGPAPEPEWEFHDRPGTLWVTDRAPAAERREAGLFTSGGAAVPGPIAADGHETILWDGTGLVRAPAGEPRAFVLGQAADGGQLPPVLVRVARAWSEARGFVLAHARTRSANGALLELVPEPASSRVVPVQLGRDGWNASGRAPAAGVRPDDSLAPGEDWLHGVARDGAAIPLVCARPGRIRCALLELSEPGGDPASFALSWGRLFDRWALPAPGVVALAERLEAGPARREPGSPPAEAADPAQGCWPFLDAALALLAALLAGLGLLLRARAPVSRGARSRPLAAVGR